MANFGRDPLGVGASAEALLLGTAGEEEVGAFFDPIVGASGPEDLLVAGEDPFVGAEDVEVGAARPRAGMSQATLANLLRNPMALARQVQAAQTLAQNRQRTAARTAGQQHIQQLAHTKDMPVTFLGVQSPGPIAAGATLAIVTAPVSPIRITNFTVMDAIAAGFLIASIQVGRLNLFMNATAIPAERFRSASTKPPFEAPIVPASVAIVVTVTNVTGAPIQFNGVFDCIDLSQRAAA
jgi:hypothetical protein